MSNLTYEEADTGYRRTVQKIFSGLQGNRLTCLKSVGFVQVPQLDLRLADLGRVDLAERNLHVEQADLVKRIEGELAVLRHFPVRGYMDILADERRVGLEMNVHIVPVTPVFLGVGQFVNVSEVS